jgi:spore germination protein YaaH
MFNNAMKDKIPKFQLSQKVWRINNATLEKKEITAICFDTKEKHFFYSFVDVRPDNKWVWCKAEKLFATKQELIDSL